MIRRGIKSWHRAPIARLRYHARLRKVAREHLAATIGLLMGIGSMIAHYLGASERVTGLGILIALFILALTHFFSRR